MGLVGIEKSQGRALGYRRREKWDDWRDIKHAERYWEEATLGNVLDHLQ